MHTVNETMFKVGRVIEWLNFELLIRDSQSIMQAHTTPRNLRLGFLMRLKEVCEWDLAPR